jgi:hypothetical protein
LKFTTQKNNVHNQDGNHDDNKVRITIFFFFFELTTDGQNFLAGIVHIITKYKIIHYQYLILHNREFRNFGNRKNYFIHNRLVTYSFSNLLKVRK